MGSACWSCLIRIFIRSCRSCQDHSVSRAPYTLTVSSAEGRELLQKKCPDFDAKLHLKIVEYLFIVITLRFLLTSGGNICWGPLFRINISV